MSIPAWHEEPISKRHDRDALHSDIVKRGLARYAVPAFRLARLGADQKLQGQGRGGQLLPAAAEVGGVVLLIDAKNANVASWYARYGAVPLEDAPLTLMLPLATIKAALNAVE